MTPMVHNIPECRRLRVQCSKENCVYGISGKREDKI